MPQLTIHISRTAGAETSTEVMRDWALGRGRLTETLDADTAPLDALVLMHEPALPGVDVCAHPIAVLHLSIDGLPYDEVLCACSTDPVEQILDDLRTTGISTTLREVVRRLHPGHTCTILDDQDTGNTRPALTAVFERYFQTTGALE